MKKKLRKRTSKLDRLPDVLRPEHLWERWPSESEKAFAAFQVALGAGPSRTAELVAKRCKVSVSLINRWSSRSEWKNRISAHVDSLAHKVAVQEQTQLARGRFRRIMSENELLANMTAIAHGSIDYVLNEEGKFDIEKARRTGPPFY